MPRRNGSGWLTEERAEDLHDLRRHCLVVARLIHEIMQGDDSRYQFEELSVRLTELKDMLRGV